MALWGGGGRGHRLSPLRDRRQGPIKEWEVPSPQPFLGLSLGGASYMGRAGARQVFKSAIVYFFPGVLTLPFICNGFLCELRGFSQQFPPHQWEQT